MLKSRYKYVTIMKSKLGKNSKKIGRLTGIVWNHQARYREQKWAVVSDSLCEAKILRLPFFSVHYVIVATPCGTP